MLYGVLTPDRGSARIDGLDIRGETSAARAHLGVLPHAAGLYGNLTARENIAYFGSLHGIAGKRLARAYRRTCPRARHGELHRSPRQGLLAGPAHQGGAGAGAGARPRQIVILDEPTNGLDVMAIRNLREMLEQLEMRRAAASCSPRMSCRKSRRSAIRWSSSAGAACSREALLQEIRERSGAGDAGGGVPARCSANGGARMMRALFTVFAKEFLENLRDRRTLCRRCCSARCSARSCSARWSRAC